MWRITDTKHVKVHTQMRNKLIRNLLFINTECIISPRDPWLTATLTSFPVTSCCGFNLYSSGNRSLSLLQTRAFVCYCITTVDDRDTVFVHFSPAFYPQQPATLEVAAGHNSIRDALVPRCGGWWSIKGRWMAWNNGALIVKIWIFIVIFFFNGLKICELQSKRTVEGKSRWEIDDSTALYWTETRCGGGKVKRTRRKMDSYLVTAANADDGMGEWACGGYKQQIGFVRNRFRDNNCLVKPFFGCCIYNVESSRPMSVREGTGDFWELSAAMKHHLMECGERE